MNASNSRLVHLETVIKKYRQDFYSVGCALKEIRDNCLYQKQSFSTFERYIRVRWDMGRAHAYRLIEASVVVDNLSPIGEIIPKNEAQARPLTKLDPFSQRKVWKDFLKSELSQTALNIQKQVSAHLSRPPKKAPFQEIISKEYKKAVTDMLSQIRMARTEGWKLTSQKTALYWQKIMKEKIRWG